MMIKEHESVVLARDLPQEHLQSGDVGVVVSVHGNGQAYEVEFMTLAGKTLTVVTLEADDIRPVNSRMLPHMREIAV
jgi:hypothetical protein